MLWLALLDLGMVLAGGGVCVCWDVEELLERLKLLSLMCYGQLVHSQHKTNSQPL